MATALGRRIRSSTITVTAIAIVAFAVVVTPLVGIPSLALVPGHILDRPWTLLTSALTHAGMPHLLGNLLALLVYGIAVDLRIGRALTAVVLLASALAAALVQSQVHPAPMVGASGAVYGLIGAGIALMPTRRSMLAMGGVVVPLPLWVASLIWIPIVTLADYAGNRHIAWAAHLGGLGAGFVLGLALRWVRPDPLLVIHEERQAKRIEHLASR
jgi:uncharacterized protein